MTEPIPVPEPVRCTLLFGTTAVAFGLVFDHRVARAVNVR